MINPNGSPWQMPQARMPALRPGSGAQQMVMPQGNFTNFTNPKLQQQPQVNVASQPGGGDFVNSFRDWSNDGTRMHPVSHNSVTGQTIDGGEWQPGGGIRQQMMTQPPAGDRPPIPGSMTGFVSPGSQAAHPALSMPNNMPAMTDQGSYDPRFQGAWRQSLLSSAIRPPQPSYQGSLLAQPQAAPSYGQPPVPGPAMPAFGRSTLTGYYG